MILSKGESINFLRSTSQPNTQFLFFAMQFDEAMDIRKCSQLLLYTGFLSAYTVKQMLFCNIINILQHNCWQRGRVVKAPGS